MRNLLHSLPSVKILFPLAVLSLMTACSSVTKGTDQELFVQTPDVRDASCTLKDSKNATYSVAKTPGYVSVQRGGGDLHIKCEKENYQDGEAILVQGFESMTMGNLLVGGLIGIAVDAASGAAFKYPDNVTVLLRPEPGFVPKKPNKPAKQNSGDGRGGNVAMKPEKPESIRGIWQGTFASSCNAGSDIIGGTQVTAFVDGETLKVNVASRNSQLAGKYDYYGVGQLKPDGQAAFTEPMTGVRKLTFYFDKVNNRLVSNIDENCPIFMAKAPKATAFQDVIDRKPADIQEPVIAEIKKSPPPDLSQYEGFWYGNIGDTCFTPPDSQPVFTKVKIKLSEENVALNMKTSGNSSPWAGRQSRFTFYGVADIAASGHVQFDADLFGSKKVNLKFDENTNRFYIDIDGNCRTPMRPMPPSKKFEEVESRVAGVTVNDDGTMVAHVSQEEKSATSKENEEFDLANYRGRWKGFSAPGCVDRNSFQGSIIVEATILQSDMNIDFKFSNVFGSEYILRKQKQQFVNGVWTFEGGYGDARKVIMKLDDESRVPILYFDKVCEIKFRRA